MSLMQSVLLRISLAATVIVLVLAIAAYAVVYHQTTEQTLEELEEYVVDRIEKDSVVFDMAEDNMEVFTREYLRLYLSDEEVTEEDFWSLYFVDDENATRMKKEFFDGIYTADGNYRYGMSSFIGNNQPVDDPNFQRRLVIAYRLLAQLGPAWVNRFSNVHASFPENGIVLFWPEEPWGLNARADLPMNELGVIKAATQKENPEREPMWTGLYYDETAGDWMITYQVPVDDQGKHLINPSLDVYLTDLMGRLITDTQNGTYNFMIRKDGYLIAHPSQPGEEQQWVGELSLEKIDIPSVKRAYQLIEETDQTSDSPIHIIKNPEDNSYLAVGEMSGPDWWFVSVFPIQSIEKSAHRSAISVFIVGMLILAMILIVVYIVIRKQAEKPLRQLRHASELIGEGKYDDIVEGKISLPLKLKNEVGLLATRFVEMATKIRGARQELERIVEERTQELEIANAALREMSLLDGLTDIHNRRSFDRDIHSVFNSAKMGAGQFSLLMADIDDFKPYNDTYGHAKGDQILKEIAKVISDNIREKDRVYRYGGEEFAVILNHTDNDSAKLTAERILECVRELRIPHGQSENGIVTLSAGLAMYSDDYTSPKQLLKAADDKLYVSKREGRNRLTV